MEAGEVRESTSNREYRRLLPGRRYIANYLAIHGSTSTKEWHRRFTTLIAEQQYNLNHTLMDAPQSYDKLASVYHLMFEDWEASMERQAVSLSQLLSKYGVKGGSQRILDCACGIGTQSLGLAKRGFKMTGSDISFVAVERARAEASKRELSIDFVVADMRDLAGFGDRLFDAVICMDNSLPHLTTEQEVLRAATQIRSKLSSGGVFIASIRDYDLLLVERPVVQGPFFYGDGESRRIVSQVWDWFEQLQYRFHLYITRQVAGQWETLHASALYRAFRRDELEAVFRTAGFAETAWISPTESGFYQPILTAQAK